MTWLDGTASNKYVVLDEAAQHIRSPRMVQLFEELYSTARKHRTSVWTVTQKYDTFVQSSLASTVQTNSTTLVLLSHGESAREAQEQVIVDFGLNDREAALFRGLRSEKGVASELFLRTEVWDETACVRSESAKLRLVLSAFDYQVATSDARDRERQRKYIAANPDRALHEILDNIPRRVAA